jgi:hypothetical protein
MWHDHFFVDCWEEIESDAETPSELVPSELIPAPEFKSESDPELASKSHDAA